MKRKLFRWGGVAFFVLLIVSAIFIAIGSVLLNRSLPILDGRLVVDSNIDAPVVIQRDVLGVPVIMGQNRLDVAFAAGFIHGQERFFQMDLMRRTAAGELAELFGNGGSIMDRRNRIHRFRERAIEAIKLLPSEQRELLAHYTKGVNFGLNLLRAKPFEYIVLRTDITPWRVEDSLLVIWSLYLDLQGNMEGRELARGWLREQWTADQLAFMLPDASKYDSTLDDPGLFASPVAVPARVPALMGPDTSRKNAKRIDFGNAIGSNAWVLAGVRSKNGAAILANDMHLRLRLPNTWFRIELVYPDQADNRRRIVGVSLPGVPAVIAGSNGMVAWGFTNSYADTLDLLELGRDPKDKRKILTPTGWESVQVRREVLHVKGNADETIEFLDSSLGPIRIVGEKYYAIQWAAYLPGAADIGLVGMEGASNVSVALSIAQRAGIPAQNFIAGDSKGHIGWTIGGTLPAHAVGIDTTFPFRVGAQGGNGRLAASGYPALIDPKDGYLVSANNRQLADKSRYATIGDGGADLGFRAGQIRAGVASIQSGAEMDLHRLTLDDRALFVLEWRNRALAVLDNEAVLHNPRRLELRQLLERSWSGRADKDAAGYRLSRAFMYSLYDFLFGAIDKKLADSGILGRYENANPRWPAVIARLLDERPNGWLANGKSWRELQLNAIDQAIEDVAGSSQPLASATWGKINATQIDHPFVRMAPCCLHRFLSAPSEQLSGDANMPRVSAPDFGQSERLVVSPGHEESGILDMPGGQSGHPLSPFFLSTHNAWVQGVPTPLLSGAAKYTLNIVPK